MNKKIFLLLNFAVYILTISTMLSLNEIIKKPQTVLVFGGKTGWFGQKIVAILRSMGLTPICANSRLENRHDIIREIEQVKPDCIINSAGITGRPNIDWCEEHKPETIRANIIGALNLADITFIYNKHMTNIGTGYLYNYDDKHLKNGGIGFTEEDEPNYSRSFYSESKIYLEKLLLRYTNILNLRFGIPISCDWNSRNFIVKIINYKGVINEPNSFSVLEDLLPIAVEMTLRGFKGNYNFVNPGVMSHNEILELYKLHIDPSFVWKNFTVEEQNKILKTSRPNCELNANKLLRKFPNIPNIKDSVIKTLKLMGINKPF